MGDQQGIQKDKPDLNRMEEFYKGYDAWNIMSLKLKCTESACVLVRAHP